MSIKHVLGDIVGDIASLERVLGDTAEQQGVERKAAEDLFQLLPPSLQASEAFFDRLTGLWRYEFGCPLEVVSGTQVILGTHQYPEVRNLLRALRAVTPRLPPASLSTYLNRLADRSRHLDALFEARPLFFFDAVTAAEFEVVGYGQGNRTIDWRFTPAGHPPVLLEVKHRVLDLLEHFEPMAAQRAAGKTPVQPGPGRASSLFRDAHEKFLPVDSSQQIQGVWIHAYIKVASTDLAEFFRSLPDKQLHFAVLSNWDERALLLSRDSINREFLGSLFGLVEADNFIAK
jgi:hypothetical protein